MKRCLISIVFGLSLITGLTAAEKLRFADVLTDNMVLQRGKEITCWGWAKPGSKVEILLTQSKEACSAFAGEKALERPESPSKLKPTPGIGNVRIAYIDETPATFKPVTKTVTAGKDGRWQTTLGIHAASFTPTYLAARAGKKSVAIKNLLIGEVWIASGQSNMEWARTRDKMWENKGLIFNGIRYAKVRGASTSPRDSFVQREGAFEPWIVCEDGAVDRVSTIAYLFAQYLHRRLKVPVGVINIAQGGSFAREWCGRERLDKMNSPTLNAQLSSYDQMKKEKAETGKWRGAPTELYNARLFPIRKMTVAGVIYMQGENESLCGDLPQYGKTLPGVIHAYRDALSSLELPFGIITLQGYGGYAVAREIHLETHERTAHTGYVVAHDIGGNIHPSWKRPLAERAVYWALRDVYKVLDGVKQNRIKGVQFKEKHALVEFIERQLKNGKWTEPKASTARTNDQQRIAGFEIAGKDRVWYRARIAIDSGDSKGILLSHPFVPEPVAVRYAWCGFPCGNLGSWEDPSPPYRSDDWPVVAKDEVAAATPGALSPAEKNYLSRHEKRNRELEDGLKLGIIDSYEQLTKRYAHPKGMLLKSVENMRTMMQTFRLDLCQSAAPELRRLALHNIPCRYWRRDRYSPARRAKWGWLIERAIRLEDLPKGMEQALENQAVKAKIVDLQKALDLLQHELEKLPDPEAITMDQMLDKILPIMESEKKRVAEERGLDMEKYKGELSKNPF